MCQINRVCSSYNTIGEVDFFQWGDRMKKGKKPFLTLFHLLALILMGIYLTTGLIQSNFATNSRKANVIITINKDGSYSYKGDLLGGGLLYPARVEEAEKGIGGIIGVIRIHNQYNNMRVENLGVGLDKGKFTVNNEYPLDLVYESFLRDVRLKIEKGRLFTFDKTLVDYASIGHLIKGYELAGKDRFTIKKGATVDLKYILYMDLEAGNELQSVTAQMPIYINVHERCIIDDGEDHGNGGYDDNGRGHMPKDEETTEVEITEEPVSLDQPHWAHDCIISLLNHGVITGYPHEEYTIEDYFSGAVDPVTYVNEAVLPDSLVTRAETAVLIARALGLKEEYAATIGYKDYIPNWARGYVIATTRANIFEGYPSGLFKANNYITREEMIAVLSRAFNISLKDKSLELPFEDKDQIGNWALEYVKAGYESKVIEGYPDNTYKPKNNISRGETFTNICKLMGLHEEHTQFPEQANRDK